MVPLRRTEYVVGMQEPLSLVSDSKVSEYNLIAHIVGNIPRRIFHNVNCASIVIT